VQVPKPDVVLASYESFTADAAELKAITWEAVVLDERHPWQRAALAKAHTALCDLTARCDGRRGDAGPGWLAGWMAGWLDGRGGCWLALLSAHVSACWPICHPHLLPHFPLALSALAC
jgi:hypothetical protein